jgi:hypothetical protein
MSQQARQRKRQQPQEGGLQYGPRRRVGGIPGSSTGPAGGWEESPAPVRAPPPVKPPVRAPRVSQARIHGRLSRIYGRLGRIYGRRRARIDLHGAAHVYPQALYAAHAYTAHVYGAVHVHTQAHRPGIDQA